MKKEKMKVEIQNCGNCVCNIPLGEFPERYTYYHKTIERGSTKRGKKVLTICLEHHGMDFLGKCLGIKGAKMPDIDEVKNFIEKIAWWMGRPASVGIIYSPNSNRSKEEVAIEVRKAVIKAVMALQDEKDGLKSAVEILDDVYGIDISIASKILRMMLPQKAGAFDSILQGALSYIADGTGYADFCRNCGKVAKKLKARRIKHPMRGDHKWFVADVEAVIYAHFNPDFTRKK